MFAVDISSLYTFSGILVILSAFFYVVRQPIASAVLLIIAGSGGSAVAWDRWSERSGEQVHLTAFVEPVLPTAGELTTLLTHFPLLVIGLVFLMVTLRERSES